MENCFIKSKQLITTASGWLQRLVRPCHIVKVIGTRTITVGDGSLGSVIVRNTSGLRRHRRNASTAAESRSACPVLCSTSSEATVPLARVRRSRKMPEPVMRCRRAATGYSGCGVYALNRRACAGVISMGCVGCRGFVPATRGAATSITTR
jgi:hypothetical protein